MYAEYRKSGYSQKYLAEHAEEIALHKAAKLAFDELGVSKLPTIKSLQAEYAQLLEQKKAAYAEYRTVRAEMKELVVHRENLKQILNRDDKEKSRPVQRS